MWREIEIDSWSTFNQIIDNNLNERNWIFRGQCSTEWDLTSSLYREIKNMTQL